MEDGIETTRTAAAEGVRVRKTIETGPAETAVVTLEVAVERDEPTTVRITEPALGAVPRDEIELHTDHGAEYWQVGDVATFERGFDAGESYEVVYRVTGVDADRFDALDADPAVDPTVDPTGDAIDDLVDRDDSDAVRELVAGERESLAATAPAAGGVELSLEAAAGGPAEDTSSDEASVDAAPEEISVGVPEGDEMDHPDDTSADPDAGDDAIANADEEETTEVPAAEPPAGDGVPSADLDASLAATPSGGVARVLLKELREGHVDEATREALREELEPGRSQDVRIKHLQSQVAEFSAYVEMLDGFVDEHGTFDAVFGGMSSLDEEVASVRSELDGLEDAVEAVDGATAEVEDLRDGHGDLEARVDRLAEQLEAVDDRLDEFDEFKERLSGAFQGVGDAQ